MPRILTDDEINAILFDLDDQETSDFLLENDVCENNDLRISLCSISLSKYTLQSSEAAAVPHLAY